MVKRRLKRFEREATKDAVLVHQRDGTTRTFDEMTVLREVFLLKYYAALGMPPQRTAFVEALDNATPESRRAVEEMGAGGFYDDIVPADGPPEDLSEP